MLNYDDDSIQLYDGLDHVRKRPGMYIGGIDKAALHRLANEIISNAVEEAMSGLCTSIEIVLRKDQIICIKDDSSGLPLDPKAEDGRTFAELEMTFMGCGYSKEHAYPMRRYFVCGALHGVGLSAINALCEWMSLEIRRDGFMWQQDYDEGIPFAPFEMIRPLDPHEATGNIFTFRPDFSIFERNEFDYDSITARCREVACQVAGLRVICRDERLEPAREIEFMAKDGLLSMLNDLRGANMPLHEAIYRTNNVDIRHPKFGTYKIGIDFAFQFTESSETILRSYVNTVQTVNGGTHEHGLKGGLHNYFNSISDGRYRWRDIARGFIGVISIRHPDPQFVGSLKVELGNSDVYKPTSKLVFSAAKEAGLDKNFDLMRPINRSGKK